VRIVYLSPAGVLGGAERSLLDLLASVRGAESAAELHLIAAAEGPLLEQARDLGVRVRLLPMPGGLAGLGTSGLREVGRVRRACSLARRGAAAGWALWRYARCLRAVIGELEPDVVHSNGVKFHLLTRLAGLRRCPVVWHVRDFLSLRPLLAPALRWASAGAGGAIAISHAVARDVRKVLPRLSPRVVYNAVDTDTFSPGPADGSRLDALAGLPPAEAGTLRVGLVATFARWKGQELFLEAAARLFREWPQYPARFYLIGGAIYQTNGSQFSEQELRSKAAALGLRQQVGLIDFQRQTADVYRALDVVVHASTQPEPFGRTVVEAMACGRPVVVARDGGAAELFAHDHDAVGFVPGSADALAAAVRRLAGDPDACRRIGENARRTAVLRFNRARLGPEVLAVYDALLRSGCNNSCRSGFPA
jgi:glycosyltransferase involved in cell wall biosynthesis